MTFRFFLQPNRSENFSLIGRFSDGAIVKNKPTGITTKNHKYWKANRQIEGQPAAEILIKEWTAKYKAYIDTCLSNSEVPDIEEAVKAVCFLKAKNGSDDTVADAIEKYIKSKETKLSTGTIGNYRCTIRLIGLYDKYRQGEIDRVNGLLKSGKKGISQCDLSPIRLSKLTKFFFNDFVTFLVKEQGTFNSTALHEVQQLKAVFKWAVNFDVIDFIPTMLKPELETPASSRPALSEEEIETIKEYKTIDNLSKVVLEAYIFACEVSLRYSDLKQIRPTNLTRTIDGCMLRFWVQKAKSKKEQVIPVSKFAEEILRRRTIDDNTPFFNDLPRISSHSNRVLKVLFKKMELNRIIERSVHKGAQVTVKREPLHKIVSFHTARHTCATTLIRRGVAIEFVQKQLGHSDIKTTSIYAKVEQSTLAHAYHKAMNATKDKELATRIASMNPSSQIKAV